MKILPKKIRARVLTTLCPSILIRAMAMDIFIPCLPVVAVYFSAPISKAQLVMSIYFIGAGLGQLFFGPLSDRYGRKPVMIGSIIFLGIVSFACSMASSLLMLTLLRLLQGVAASGTSVVIIAMIRDLYDDQSTPGAYSHLSAITGLAQMFAPYIGGSILVRTGNWQDIFYFVTTYSIITLYITYKFVGETSPKYNKHVTNHLVLEIGPEFGFGAGRVRNTLNNYRKILTDKEFLIYLACAINGLVGLILFFSCSSVLLIERLGLMADKYGLCFVINSAMYMFGNMLSPFLQRKHGINKVIFCGALLMLAGALVMLVVEYYYGLSVFGVILPNCIITLGIGLLYGPCSAGAMRKYKIIAGTASAVYGAILYCTAALIVSAIMLIDMHTSIPLAVTMLCAGALIVLCISIRARIL